VLPLGWIADYDYSDARARLVASVPGTSAGVSAGRHAGPALHRWGSAAAQARLGLMMRQASLAPAWLP
jgi:hypothetical protein